MLVPVKRYQFHPAKPLAAQHSRNGQIHWDFGPSAAGAEDKLGTAMSGAVWAAFCVAREYLNNTRASDVEPLELENTLSRQTSKVESPERPQINIAFTSLGYRLP